MSGSLKQGLMAEHLVIIDILRSGFYAYAASPTMAYDVVADVDGKLLRIQVKSTRGLKETAGRTPFYSFSNNSVADAADYDLVALIALDIGVVAYLPKSVGNREKITLPAVDAKAARRRKIDEYSFLFALKQGGFVEDQK
jgi:hypothetical protein